MSRSSTPSCSPPLSETYVSAAGSPIANTQSVIAARAAPWSWAVLGATALLRFAVALAVGKSVLQDPNLLRDLWLLPVRDLIAVAVWIASFAGHTVTWRGDRFELKNGRLIRIDRGSDA